MRYRSGAGLEVGRKGDLTGNGVQGGLVQAGIGVVVGDAGGRVALPDEPFGPAVCWGAPDLGVRSS